MNSRISLSECGIDLSCCSPKVREAIQIMNKKYLTLKSVKEISDELGISEATLSNYFKRYYPIGPKKLLTTFKIRHAIYLMKNFELSLKEIAYLVGYPNQRRFSECFRRILGISPNKYRKNIQTN